MLPVDLDDLLVVLDDLLVVLDDLLVLLDDLLVRLMCFLPWRRALVCSGWLPVVQAYPDVVARLEIHLHSTSDMARHLRSVGLLTSKLG